MIMILGRKNNFNLFKHLLIQMLNNNQNKEIKNKEIHLKIRNIFSLIYFYPFSTMDDKTTLLTI